MSAQSIYRRGRAIHSEKEWEGLVSIQAQTCQSDLRGRCWSIREAGAIAPGSRSSTSLHKRTNVCIRLSPSQERVGTLTERRRGARDLPWNRITIQTFATLHMCRARFSHILLLPKEHFEMNSATGASTQESK